MHKINLPLVESRPVNATQALFLKTWIILMHLHTVSQVSPYVFGGCRTGVENVIEPFLQIKDNNS